MKKVLLTAVLSIVLCLSLVTGATLALFTSESKVNVAVTSGTVDVVATLGGLEYKTLTKEWQTADGNSVSFDGIGSEAIMTDNALTLTNIVPGDGVKVAVKIVNKSTVAVAYEIKTVVTGTNAEELITEITTASGEPIPTGWQTLTTIGGDVEDLAVTVELPATATKQDMTANVEIVVTAVQANAAGGAVLKNVKYDTFAEAAAVAVDGDTIQLGYGSYTMPAAISGKNVTVKGYGNATVINMQSAFNANGASYTFENLYIEGKNSNTGNGYGIQTTTGAIVYKNCTINNSFTNEFRGTVEYNGCTFTGTYYVWTYSVQSAAFIDCTFDKTDSRAILVYSHGNNPVNVTVDGCTFKAAAKGYTGVPAWTAAVEVDTSNITTAGTTVTITDSSADANYNGIVRDKSSNANAVITVNGTEGVASAKALQAKIDAAAAGTTTIKFLANINGNATIKQKEGVNLVIDGKGYEYDGQILINGDARSTGAETVTIQNVNFNTSAAAVSKETSFNCIYAPSKVDGRYNYSHNITVKDCTFATTTKIAGYSYNEFVVGIQVNSSYNLKVEGCTATNIHSLMQAESCKTTVTVDGCEVIDCKSGVSFNNTQNAVIKNTKITAVGEDGYGVRVKAEQPGYALTVEDCEIDALLVPVLVRNATSTYTVTFNGTNTLTSGAVNTFGYEVVICSGDWDNGSIAPTAPTGTITVNGTTTGFDVYKG